jgi:hypothetical protein
MIGTMLMHLWHAGWQQRRRRAGSLTGPVGLHQHLDGSRGRRRIHDGTGHNLGHEQWVVPAACAHHTAESHDELVLLGQPGILKQRQASITCKVSRSQGWSPGKGGAWGAS